MNGPLIALSLLPAAALAASYPRRSGAAAAASVLAIGAATAMLFLTDPAGRREVVLVSCWAVAGSAWAWQLCRRRAKELRAAQADLERIRAQSQSTHEELERLRARGAEIEREHCETLAIYGMIKGLSEAISWEDVRPKLESAVDQYLGLSEFALYAASAREPGQFRPLAVRRLDGSPGGAWVTLERYLQERGLTAAQPHCSQRPEAAVGLPIQDNNELLGYFYARVPKGADPRALLTKSQRFVEEIGFAFRRLKLFQEVESLSRIDGLTGVYRRGDFDDRLRHEVMRAKTFKTTFCLMLLDIDHFKLLNDRYGHPFGDQVLKRVGELLNASVYETDFVARYGGEEFVVILPRAEPDGALRRAEAIRRAIEGEKFPLALETIQATASIGVAHFPRDAATPEELVAQADAAMYQAKSQGRNRIVDCRALRQS